MSTPTKITVTKRGSVYFYILEDEEHRIEFSLSAELFDDLRRAEEAARLQNESAQMPLDVV